MREQIRIAAVFLLFGLAVSLNCVAFAQDGGGPYPPPPQPPTYWGITEVGVQPAAEPVVTGQVIAEIGDGGECTWWSVFWGSFWFWE